MTRSLAFAKYLRDWDWDVTVLTVSANAYPEVRQQNNASIPAHVQCVRSLAFDTQRHLSLFGRYPLLLATPDRWQSWIVSGFLSAARIIGRQRPDAIMSTYPIASAHCIAYYVHCMFHIPWIADFRDPMAQADYPPEPRLHRAFERIEKRIFTHAARVVVTTPGAASLYASRFPAYKRQNIVTISNGFDPEMFSGIAMHNNSLPRIRSDQPLKLLHSGLLYPSERDPTQLFAAIAELLSEDQSLPDQVQFVFRAAGNDADYKQRIRNHGLEKLVHILPAVPYADALAEIATADGLLLLQASNCNEQIPAKLYEYLYCGRPILALTDAHGDTGKLLVELGITSIADLADKVQIKKMLLCFIEQVRSGTTQPVAREVVMQFSRRDLTGELARQLNAISTSPAA